MEKTDKSLAEMEVEANQKWQSSKILESGKELERLSGTGLCGIHNLGNTCYLNSIMQLVSRIPEVEGRYKDTAFALRKVEQPDTDLLAQFAKFVNALVTDRYATSSEDELGKEVRPQQFKSLIGAGHPEFSTGRQQDAAEFFEHLLDRLESAEKPVLGSRLGSGTLLSSLFEFEL